LDAADINRGRCGVGGGVFIGDLMLPLEVAGGVPYVAVVAVGWWLPWHRYIFLLALVSSILILAGYLYSPPGGIFWVVAANRLLALFVV
jgi:two-component system sensor kinase FixL